MTPFFQFKPAKGIFLSKFGAKNKIFGKIWAIFHHFFEKNAFFFDFFLFQNIVLVRPIFYFFKFWSKKCSILPHFFPFLTSNRHFCHFSSIFRQNEQFSLIFRDFHPFLIVGVIFDPNFGILTFLGPHFRPPVFKKLGKKFLKIIFLKN